LNKNLLFSNSYEFLLIEMEAATPRGLADGLCAESEAAGARALDPGLSLANVFVFATSNRRSKGSG